MKTSVTEVTEVMSIAVRARIPFPTDINDRVCVYVQTAPQPLEAISRKLRICLTLCAECSMRSLWGYLELGPLLAAIGPFRVLPVWAAHFATAFSYSSPM